MERSAGVKDEDDGPPPPPREQQETLPHVVVEGLTETVTVTGPRANAEDVPTETGRHVIEFTTTKETAPPYPRRTGPQGTLVQADRADHDGEGPTSVFARHEALSPAPPGDRDADRGATPAAGREGPARASSSPSSWSSGERRPSGPLASDGPPLPRWLLLVGALTCLAIGATAAWLMVGQP